MAWFYLVLASFGEIFGVFFINLFIRNKSFVRLLGVTVAFGFGFIFLAQAMKEIPMGTAYAIWTGLGAAGAVIMGITLFKESANVKRLFFLCCIIGGATGLKLLEG